jgi:hypothetical protein
MRRTLLKSAETGIEGRMNVRRHESIATKAQPYSKSLRTTVPTFVSDFLELEADELLVWSVDLDKQTVTVTKRPLKPGEEKDWIRAWRRKAGAGASAAKGESMPSIVSKVRARVEGKASTRKVEARR